MTARYARLATVVGLVFFGLSASALAAPSVVHPVVLRNPFVASVALPAVDSFLGMEGVAPQRFVNPFVERTAPGHLLPLRIENPFVVKAGKSAK